MQGICKLCKNEAQLKVSHFIPQFIGKWMKETSITGYLRSSSKVRKRAQDIEKEYWLCGECEGLFSAWETKFANEVFHPLINQRTTAAVNYTDWMAKFCASLSWRSLTYIRSKNKHDEQDLEYCKVLDNAETHLSNYLLGSIGNLNQYEQHVFFLERIEMLENVELSSKGKLPPNINRYLMRSIGMDIVEGSSNLFVYTKLPSLILLGLIKSKNSSKMRKSRVSLKSGKIKEEKCLLPIGFENYIFEKAKEIAEAHEEIPNCNVSKFDEFIVKKPEKTANSRFFEAFLYDHEQFGNAAFRKGDS